MPYQFSSEVTNQQTDRRKPPGGRKKPCYDFNAFKCSYDNSKDSTLDDSISFPGQRNPTDQSEETSNSLLQGQAMLFQQQSNAKDYYHNFAEPFQENKQAQQKRQSPTLQLQRPGQQEKQLFYQQKLNIANIHHGLNSKEFSQDGCSKPAEHEKATEHEASQHAAYQPFTESFRNMTIRDLIDQCQDHVCVINTCNMLQKIVTDELMKQVKLDDIVYQKLTARSQRLQQQIVFLEKVQAPGWVKAVLDDLITLATNRAQIHKAHAENLLKECETIQCSIDESQDIAKTLPAAAGRSQETKDDEDTRVETSLNSLQTSKASDDTEDKAGCKSFLQTNETFEGIRKPWMKFLSLLEYQQEQYDATLTQIEQVENEIEKLLSTEEAENSLWRTQIKKKDLETKKELLEARKEHLATDVSNAKKDIADFELNNRDNILDVLNALRQHRNRCDTILRDNFQLLKAASQRGATCLGQHINKHQLELDEEEDSDNKQTSVACKSWDSWSCINSLKDHPSAAHMSGDASCAQGSSCALFRKQINDFAQMKNSAVVDVANGADFVSRSPVRDFKESRFQNHKHFHSYMLLSDSDSGPGSKTNMRDVPSVDAIKSRYVHTKPVYGTDGYKTTSSDFNVSRANKDSPVAASEAACEEVDAVASPDCNDDPKTTSWSISSSQAEQQCHSRFKSNAFAADNKEKASQLARDNHGKHPYPAQPSLYQNICGREYTSHSVDKTDQGPSVDVYEKELTSNLRYYRTGVTKTDVLSNKEVRAAYFINKYAGGRKSDRSFLTKNMNGIRPLGWRSGKDYSVKKLGRSCHGHGNRTSRENLAKRGSNKRKNDSKTLKERSVGMEKVEICCCEDVYGDSSAAEDVYSDSSTAEDDKLHLQNTSFEHSK